MRTAGVARDQVAAASERGRRATTAAFIGFLVDNYDIYLPILVLGPAMIYFLPDTLSIPTKTTLSALIFGVTLVGRPLGSLIFGQFADRLGRRRTSIVSGVGFGTSTLLIGLLPGFSPLGWAAVGALLVLRLIDGMFLGGQYSAATPLALESNPPQRRGRIGGTIASASSCAFVVVAVITLILLNTMPTDGPDSAYVQWGWRIPFILGAVFAYLYVWYIVARVEESTLWKQTKEAESADTRGLRTLFITATARTRLLQVFVYMTGLWFLLNSYTAILPWMLTSVTELSSNHMTLTILLAAAINVLMHFGGGCLSQYIGRRRYLMIAIPLGTIAGVASYASIAALGSSAPLTSVTLAVLGSALLVSPWALSNLYIPELFRTENRGAGFGIGYSFTAIIPAFYAFYQDFFTKYMDRSYTVVVLIIIGGVLAVTGVSRLPETRDLDFSSNTAAS